MYIHFFYQLSVTFPSGLQGGVGESDPGAAAEGEQPHWPAGAATDR